ncbi:MAG: hypothetical protein WEC75_09680 [Dehalococcoidia bacterium]
MDRSASFTIVIVRTPDGYKAVAPAFPRLIVEAHSSRAAYKQLKDRITREVGERFAISQPIPSDPVVQTRTLRLDLWHLRQKEELQ